MTDILTTAPFFGFIEHSWALDLRDIANLLKCSRTFRESKELQRLLRKRRAQILWKRAWDALQPAFVHSLNKKVFGRVFRQHERVQQMLVDDTSRSFMRGVWQMKLMNLVDRSRQRSFRQMADDLALQQHHFIRPWSYYLGDVDVSPLPPNKRTQWQSMLSRHPRDGADPTWPWWISYAIEVTTTGRLFQ